MLIFIILGAFIFATKSKMYITGVSFRFRLIVTFLLKDSDYFKNFVSGPPISDRAFTVSQHYHSFPISQTQAKPYFVKPDTEHRK
jgi:hypothetical protein